MHRKSPMHSVCRMSRQLWHALLATMMDYPDKLHKIESSGGEDNGKSTKTPASLKVMKMGSRGFPRGLKGGEKISSVQVPFSSSKINWISPLDWEDFEHFLGNWDDRVLVLLCDRYWMTAWSLRYWNSMLSISSVGTPYIFTRSDAEPRKKPIFSLVVVFPKSGGHQERDVSLEDSLTLK